MPKEIDEQIDSTLVAISPIRAIANVVKVGSAGYRKLVTTGGTPSGWAGFEAARPETNTPSFTEIVPASGELYANPAASQQMLDDAMFDVEAWLAGEVELADNEHWLESRDEDALIQGANLAAVGSELIQFGVATAIGPGLFRLSKLLRGRRGTEWAMNAHSPGEHFVMIGSGSVRPIELPPEALGAQVDVTAFAVGDGNGTTIGTVARGEALRPPSPVHVRWSVALAGSLELSWVRRSRNGWMWRDEIETPLGETGERYRVRVQAETGAIELETTASQATVSAAELAAVGSGAATVTVFQVGDYALSRPAAVSIILP